MAYTYRNKKTGEVIYLNRRVNTAFWEEVEPEQEETFEEETFEEETFEEDPEQENPEQEEPAEAPKKTTEGRGKK